MVMQWALVGVFVVIGLVATCAGLSRVVRREYLRRHGCLAMGTVVAIHHATVEASSVFAPVVAFPTDRGNFEVTGPFACPCFYEVGQQVPVCYAPQDPERGVILTRQEVFKAWGLLVGGMVLFGIGAALGLVI
jgi:Protein of unknown function (DUF3592)